MKKFLLSLLILLLTLSTLYLFACDNDNSSDTPLTEHTHTYTKTVTDPTCTEKGYTTYTCACGYSYIDNETLELGHNKKQHSAKNATCTELGCKAYETCSRCDFTSYEVIESLGHDYTKNANDSQNHWKECVRCNDKKDVSEHSFDVETFCSCGYGCQHKEGTLATCISQAVCAMCGNKYGELTKHTPMDVLSVLPTCTESGLTKGSKCTVCQQTLIEQQIVGALGHVEEEISAVAPTCTKTGLTAGVKCLTCKQTLVVQEEVSVLGHEFTNYIYNNDASQEIDGTKTAICNREACEEKETLIALGTKINECLVFAQRNNTYSVCDYIGTETSLVIPEYLLGKPITTIEKYAFLDCTSLQSITIPNSVTNIASSAVMDCSSLESITVEDGNTVYHSKDNCLIETATNTLIIGCKNSIIPNYVTSIASSAFYGCSNLTNIIIPNSVTSIGAWAFLGCSYLTNITIPKSVTSIGDSAFDDCSSLKYNEDDSALYLGNNDNKYLCLIEVKNKNITSYEINSNVKFIYSYAFYDCSSLTNITIPNSVTSIGDSAFAYCDSLTNIVIPSSVISIGECAFKYCRNLTCITISKGVTSIGRETFNGCRNLESIIIPNGVTSIGEKALSGCYTLTSITISSSVMSIGLRAFDTCKSLTNIKFAGTMAQWESVSKDIYWDDNTGSYIIQCDDGDIVKA